MGLVVSVGKVRVFGSDRNLTIIIVDHARVGAMRTSRHRHLSLEIIFWVIPALLRAGNILPVTCAVFIGSTVVISSRGLVVTRGSRVCFTIPFIAIILFRSRIVCVPIIVPVIISISSVWSSIVFSPPSTAWRVLSNSSPTTKFITSTSHSKVLSP